MDDSISITFGIPEHGWLPVCFSYYDFRLDFETSDAGNDPIEELYHAITKLQDNEIRRVTWWLEPGVYFFDIEKTGPDICLTISETTYLSNRYAPQTILQTITGDDTTIIEPFKIAVRQFCAHTYDEIHWPYETANYSAKSS